MVHLPACLGTSLWIYVNWSELYGPIWSSSSRWEHRGCYLLRLPVMRVQCRRSWRRLQLSSQVLEVGL